MITQLLISSLGWPVVAVAFEHGYEVIRKSWTFRLCKYEACQIYWGALGILVFALGNDMVLPRLLTLGVVAVVHLDLSKHSTGQIAFRQLFRHIGTLGRRIMDKIFNPARRF